MSMYAFGKCKYNMAQGLKYWRIIKGDLDGKAYWVQFFNPNQPRDKKEIERKVCKVKVVDGFAFCTCMEHFNTGLPCMHEFLIGLRRHKKLLFSERWFQNYEKLIDRNLSFVSKILNQNEQE